MIVYVPETGLFEDSVPNNQAHWVNWLAAGNKPEFGSPLTIYLTRIGLYKPGASQFDPATGGFVYTEVQPMAPELCAEAKQSIRLYWETYFVEHPDRVISEPMAKYLAEVSLAEVSQ